MRAHQKDAYFELSFRQQVLDALHILKGQRFINTHPEEITVAAKTVYLLLTTLLGARTLGEEYVDLLYVSRSGRRLPKLLPKIGFVLSYALIPYILTRLARRFKPKEEQQGGVWRYLLSYHRVLDTLMNLHIAVFYFQGEFYLVLKRLFGLRYVFGHNKDPKKLKNTGNYSFLGGIILLQFAVKLLIQFKTNLDSRKKSKTTEEPILGDRIQKMAQLEDLGRNITESDQLRKKLSTDLSDPRQLPYLPDSSRLCMLCLSPMVDPLAASCGHIFCWDCIVDWVREHPECPLCRQQCQEQNLLPLR